MLSGDFSHFHAMQEDVDRMEAAKPDEWPTYTGRTYSGVLLLWSRVCSMAACEVETQRNVTQARMQRTARPSASVWWWWDLAGRP